MIRNAYFLDRNAISRIKEANAGRLDQKDSKKLEFVRELREMDRPDSLIMSSFSIMEGPSKGEGTPIARQADIFESSEAISAFYEKARTDAYFNRANSEFASEALSLESMIHSYKLRRKFVEASHDLLHKIEKEDRGHVVEKIISIAKQTGLSSGDLSLLMFVACVYGSPVARSILKPHKQVSAHNVLSDLYAIQNLANFEARVKEFLPNQKLESHLVTMDDGLKKLRELISFRVSGRKTNFLGQEEMSFKLNIKDNFFPYRMKKEKINYLVSIIDNLETS